MTTKRVGRIAWPMLAVLAFSTLAFARVAVTVSPSSIQVNPQAQQQFTAHVTGTSNSVVIWSVSGSGCVGQACGGITADGLYTAPAVPPSPPTVQITATSLANPASTGTATVTIGSPSNVSVAITPTEAQIPVGGKQQFNATVTGSSNQAVTWTISGVGCTGNSCGTISTSGLYTAPATVPNPSTATVTATSVADTSKSASATVIIVSAGSVSVSVTPSSAAVTAGGHQQFTAKVTGTTNSAVTWSLSGSGCSGSSCGTITTGGLYTAPTTVPTPPTVTVKATSVAAPAQSAAATVTIGASSGVTVTPSTATVKPSGQVPFSATVSSGSSVVIWSVSGTGCTGTGCGSINSTGLYTAPAVPPSPATVTVTATSLSNPALTGSATVTVSGGQTVAITISPTSAVLSTNAQKQFNATVTGTTNTAVTWSVSGFGCAGSACGTITSSGLYTAPSALPVPNLVTVTATSQADSTKSASATVTINTQTSVTITPTSAKVDLGQSQQFTAMVNGSSNQVVYWTVSGAGCTGSACGTINSAGLYTAPDSLPSPSTVKVTATAQEDPTETASATVTLVTPVVVTISPLSAVVSVTEQQQFQATVTGNSNTAVTWSLSGTGCSGAACGTISSKGLYTAPATVPKVPTVTVTATSQADSSKSASAKVTVAPSDNAKLNGQYAFLFKGFDALGVYQSAGTFTADGNGNLSSGEEDINRTTGPATQVALKGSYKVTADNRGTMTMITSAGTSTFKFALNLTGKSATFIEFDSSGIRGSGVFKLQDSTAFDPSALTGGYAFSLSGMDGSGGRIGALGAMFPDGVSGISGSSVDVNDAGIVYPTFGTFFGTYSVDSNGRGTASLSIPGFLAGTFNFAFYVVSANELLLVSIDPLSLFPGNPIFAGPAEAQVGSPYLNTSFQGGSVFNLTGFDYSFPEVTVGRLAFDGSSNVTGIYDKNSGGTVTSGAGLAGAYSVQLNGRGVLNLQDLVTGYPIQWVMYAYAPNSAFVLDVYSSSVGVGEMKNQVVIPPVGNANLLGNFILGSGEPADWSVPLSSGVSYFDGSSNKQGLGSVTGTEDQSTASDLAPNVAIVGNYAVSLVSANGRGSILLTAPATSNYAFWLVSASELFAIGTDPTDVQPTILFFEQ